MKDVMYTVETDHLKQLVLSALENLNTDYEVSKEIVKEIYLGTKGNYYPFGSKKHMKEEVFKKFKCKTYDYTNTKSDLEEFKYNLDKHVEKTFVIEHNLLYNVSQWSNNELTNTRIVYRKFEKFLKEKFFKFDTPDHIEVFKKYGINY